MNTYECAHCGGVFEKGRTDEEALAEKDANFSDVPLEDCAVVCEDCFQEMNETAKREQDQSIMNILVRRLARMI